MQTITGPWKTLARPDGDIPFYVVPFDKAGTCTGPRTQDELVKVTAESTDVFLFSHGWNNDWKAATGRYERFIDAFRQVRRAYWDPPDRDFHPVLAGIFWPSTLSEAFG